MALKRVMRRLALVVVWLGAGLLLVGGLWTRGVPRGAFMRPPGVQREGAGGVEEDSPLGRLRMEGRNARVEADDRLRRLLEDSSEIELSPPSFLQAEYRVEVLEGEEGVPRVVARVGAVAGEGGPLSFTLREERRRGQRFQVEAGTGAVTLTRALDREQQAEHRLTLTVTEGGGARLTASATLTVMVIDTNDNAPRFPEEETEVVLVGRVEEGVAVATVTATDADDPQTEGNGKVEYRVAGEVGEFAVDRVTGVVSTRVGLEVGEWRLEVVAEDGGGLTASTFLNISVEEEVEVEETDLKEEGEVVDMKAEVVEDKKDKEVMEGLKGVMVGVGEDRQDIKARMERELGARTGVMEEVKGEAKEGMNEALKGEVKGQVKEEVKEDTNEGLKEQIKEKEVVEKTKIQDVIERQNGVSESRQDIKERMKEKEKELGAKKGVMEQGTEERRKRKEKFLEIQVSLTITLTTLTLLITLGTLTPLATQEERLATLADYCTTKAAWPSLNSRVIYVLEVVMVVMVVTVVMVVEMMVLVVRGGQ